MTDWWLTGNRQKTNGILWPRLYVHKNTKGTDQLKRTWKISEKILTSIDVHWILCTQQNLNNYTLQSSLSWGELSPWVGSLSKNKQKWIKKLPNIYGIITHTFLWMEECYYSFWMGWKNKVLKFLFLFLLIIFALDNVLILNEEKLLVDHF